MKAQSLSVVVPNKQCINNCAFCVSHMHTEEYKNLMDDGQPLFDLYLKDYLKRLDFAQRNGCNTVMLTGNTEPQQNRKFLTYFGLFMQMMRNPFDWIEIQTTGLLLDRNYLRFLRNHVGVNLISLSVSSFDDDENASIIGMPEGMKVNLRQLCADIKEYDFTLRLSLNLNKSFLPEKEDISLGDNLVASMVWAEELFKKCQEFGADQVTMRVLYASDNQTPQSKWVKEHAMPYEYLTAIGNHVQSCGKPLGILPYGATKYSLHGMSVVVDNDCMGKGVSNEDNSRLPEQDTYKYLILRPDCKLYSQWDDKASLIF